MDISVKKIVFDQIKAKFANLPITQIVCEYCVKSELTEITGLLNDNRKEKIDLSKAENSLVRNMLIKKIIKYYEHCGEYPSIDIEKIVVSIWLSTEQIKIYAKIFDVKELQEIKMFE